MYRKILQEPLHFPGLDIVPAAAKDLLTRLLDRNPERRLGANGASEIKAHHFFSNIDWRKLLQRKYEPSFKPNVVSWAQSFLQLLMANRRLRLMHSTLLISIESSPQKLQWTRMLTDQCFHKRCSSSSQDGPTIDLWLAWVMLVAVLEIPPLVASSERLERRHIHGRYSRRGGQAHA